MRKNVIKRIWEEAGRFRSKTGVDPTVVYLGVFQREELFPMNVTVARLGKVRVVDKHGVGWARLGHYLSGRLIIPVAESSYLRVGI
jgi:hypothetical protein